MSKYFRDNWIAGSGISAIIAMLWLAQPIPPAPLEPMPLASPPSTGTVITVGTAAAPVIFCYSSGSVLTSISSANSTASYIIRSGVVINSSEK
jgi:hypothetical protein